MSRRVFQIAVALVLLFGTLTPLANCFDTWDKGAATLPSNDTEIHLTAWFVGVGFVLVTATLIPYIPALSRDANRVDSLRHLSISSPPAHHKPPEPTGSPPLLALRI